MPCVKSPSPLRAPKNKQSNPHPDAESFSVQQPAPWNASQDAIVPRVPAIPTASPPLHEATAYVQPRTFVENNGAMRCPDDEVSTFSKLASFDSPKQNIVSRPDAASDMASIVEGFGARLVTDIHRKIKRMIKLTKCPQFKRCNVPSFDVSVIQPTKSPLNHRRW